MANVKEARAEFQKMVQAKAEPPKEPATLAGAQKRLVITLHGFEAPTYDFQGTFVGRDIMLIGRTIARAYRKQQLAARRAGSEQPTQTEVTSNV